MALVKRAEVSAPELQREIVPVEALKGDVAVVEMSLADRLDFEEAMRTAKGSKRSITNVLLPQLLAACVLDAEDEPVFTVKQWQAFAARNRDATIVLFNVAFRLCGFDGSENEKNS